MIRVQGQVQDDGKVEVVARNIQAVLRGWCGVPALAAAMRAPLSTWTTTMEGKRRAWVSNERTNKNLLRDSWCDYSHVTRKVRRCL